MGLDVISRRPNGELFQEMIDHPAPNYPDDLARSPKPMRFIPVDEKLVLSDSLMTVWVLWTRNNTHMIEDARIDCFDLPKCDDTIYVRVNQTNLLRHLEWRLENDK